MTTIWTYWRSRDGGPLPAFYQLCWETISRHNPTAKLVTPETLVDMGGREPLDASQGLPIAIESDLARFWLLREYGGIWVDLDSICFQPILAAFPDVATSYDLCVVRNPRRKHWSKRFTVASPFAARAGSRAAIELYRRSAAHAARQRSGQHVPWGTTSCGVLSQVAKTSLYDTYQIPASLWHPIPSRIARAVFLRKGNPDSHALRFNPETVLTHLSNPIPAAFRSATRWQILHSRHYVSHLLQLALGVSPAVPPRTCAILRRIPSDTPSTGVEVGVFQARNASSLLQQRPNLRLTTVDPYSEVKPDSTYRTTADYQARFTQDQWAAIRHTARHRLDWAAMRVTWIEQPSALAAQQVPDRSVDWVWIDGDHSPAAVAADLLAWQGKVRPGGWIGGHDYHHPRERKRGYGVTQAVDAWAQSSGVTIETDEDTTWFARA